MARTFGIYRAVLCLLVAVVAGGPARVLAQASMLTVRTNGPAANRFNIVFLSEGYTGSQMPQYLVDATNALTAILSHPPYQEYSSYFNAFAIQTNSLQSGSDHPNANTYVNTCFNSTYDPVSDYYITIPADSSGQGRVDALIQTFMPSCNLPVLLVNDPNHAGGSDGFGALAIAATSYSMPELLTHETGQVVANLGDEYDYPYPGFPDTEEPNTTRETNRALIKWNAWIASSTPVPTAPPDSYPAVIGLFEGAHYHSTGWYRPRLDCLMRDNYVPFCEVCSEALVLAFYRNLRPVDAFSPATTNLSVSTPQAVTFSVTLLQPATHNLSVQWQTNHTTVAGATSPAFTLSPASLGNGSHLESAVVRDNTPLVRNDPANRLSQTVTWSVNVVLPQLRLDSPLWVAGGRFAFRILGTAPEGVVIQGSTDLRNWFAVATNSLVGGQLWYTNSEAGGSPRRFYRAVTAR
ncbi:MAG: M64 family metallo-endopeptidase [Verrucomicrobia bacterium]|nr:M64 family metallo-endopeptidase [Verrucomicrobiota bacterium]